jgi:hypothetical protein
LKQFTRSSKRCGQSVVLCKREKRAQAWTKLKIYLLSINLFESLLRPFRVAGFTDLQEITETAVFVLLSAAAHLMRTLDRQNLPAIDV